MEKVFLKLMQGIGDNLYLRPIIKELAKTKTVYLQTVLPDLFADIPNVLFVHQQADYRTQKKVMPSDKIKFVDAPDIEPIAPFYTGADLLASNIVTILARQVGVDPAANFVWDLPDLSHYYNSSGHKLPAKKIAIIRPATLRREWKVTTRPPDPNYIAWCTTVLKDYGYHTIAIADLEPKIEWLDKNLDMPADERLYKGELGLYGTLELIRRADVVVGGSGFILPAAACANTKLFTIFGGRMAYDCPQKLFHPTMNTKLIGWSVPDTPCRCTFDEHTCSKIISNLDTDFFNFITRT